jgi:hypothetical protein
VEAETVPGSKRKIRRRSRAEWDETLKRHEESGLSAREFCKQEGLALSTFMRWAKREQASPSFVDITPREESASASRWELEIELPQGIQLRFRG